MERKSSAGATPPAARVVRGALCAVLAAVSSGCAFLVRATSTDSGGDGDGHGHVVELSDDGSIVVFWSYASNLVPDDTNGSTDVFVRDLRTGSLERVSVTSAEDEAVKASRALDISSDGNLVLFSSLDDSLAPGDSDGRGDVYVRDRAAGTTERVSIAPGGTEISDTVESAAMDASGRYVAFVEDTAGEIGFHLYVADRDTDTVHDVYQPEVGLAWVDDMSADGNVVALTEGTCGGAGCGRGSRVRLYEWRTPGEGVPVSDESMWWTSNAALSGDASDVVYESESTCPSCLESGAVAGVRLLDRSTGHVASVSRDMAGEEELGRDPKISDDGRIVTYSSVAPDIVPGDTNGAQDVFLYDRETGTTERVSTRVDLSQISSGSTSSALSADGSTVAFGGPASDVVPGDANGKYDGFVRAAGAPTVDSVAPSSVRRTFLTRVRVSGDGFEPGAGVYLARSADYELPTNVEIWQTTFVDRQNIDVLLAVRGGAARGRLDVIVHNPGGWNPGTAGRCLGCLRVVDP